MAEKQRMAERQEEARQYQRFAMRLRVRWNGIAGKHEDWLSNIGMGGCFVETSGTVFVGETLSLQIQMPAGKWVTFRGEVRHFQQGIGFGVQFSETLDQDRSFF